MSRKANCWGDAVVEAFLASLKKERIKKLIYKNRGFATPTARTHRVLQSHQAS